MTCPIIVEDLERPRQMLVEVMILLSLVLSSFSMHAISIADVGAAVDAL
jgi:hypothetical protein